MPLSDIGTKERYMKNKIEGLKSMGGNICEDSKGRMYIGDRKKRILYAVDRSSKNKLTFYQQRYTLPLVALVLVGFYINWYVAVPIALAVLALLEYLYRSRFLSELTVYEDIDIPENPSLKMRLEENDMRKLLMVTCLSILLAILLIVNLFQTVTDWSQAFKDPNIAILVVVTVALDLYAIYFFFNAVSVLLKRRQQ